MKVREHLLPYHWRQFWWQLWFGHWGSQKGFCDCWVSWKVHNCFLHFIYFSVSLGNEERVSSPMSALVFIVSVVGLWWVLEAAEVLWFLQQDQERSWWSFRCLRLSDGRSQLLTAPSQGWLFPDVPFFGFLPPKIPWIFYNWDVQLQKEMELPSGLCHIPALSLFPWKNQFSMECGPGMLFPSEWVWTCSVQLQNPQLLAWATL